MRIIFQIGNHIMTVQRAHFGFKHLFVFYITLKKKKTLKKTLLLFFV